MTNKYKIPSITFKDTPNNQIAKQTEQTKNSIERIAQLDYNDVMSFLKKNFQMNRYNENRVAKINIRGYQVTINSLKLRTFIQSYIDQKDHCENPSCHIKPVYFGLERTKGKRKSKHITAYLTLYGVDKNGFEEEFTHDHTLARCFGGKNSLSNTTMMCKTCNNKKSVLESRVHHKTLTILKAYLEDTTGQKVNPKLVLQQLRKGGMNQTSIDLKVKRIEKLNISQALHMINNPNKSYLNYKGNKIKVKGLRLKTFAKQEQPCCENPQCKVKATHFAIEKTIHEHKNYGSRSYHLNMYGKNKVGKEIMFFHHHFFKTSISGVPEELVTKTLCKECKEKALLEEDMQITQNLEQPLKISKNISCDNKKILTKNKKNKIIKMLKIISRENSFSDINDFIYYCNEMGAMHFHNKLNKKRKSMENISLVFPEFSKKGIMWFKKLHNQTMENKLDSDINEMKPKNKICM